MADDWDPFADPAEEASSGAGDAGRPAAEAAAAAKPAVRGTAAGWIGPGTLQDEDEEAERPPPLDPIRRKEIVAEVQRLKLAKQEAVEEEEYEVAASLKRRIKVLEDTLGEQIQFEEQKKAASAKKKALAAVREEVGLDQPRKPLSQLEHRSSLSEMPTENMVLIPAEREFVEKSRLAMRARNVTDSTINGVPQWAYKDAAREGLQAVKTERPAELQYVFQGQIEDEKWEDGANFQTSVVVQVPVEVAFANTTALLSGLDDGDQGGGPLQISSTSYITYFTSGTAQLTELLVSEVVENETVVFRVTVTKPRVRGKVKLEAAQTVTSVEPFRQKPFYSFKSVWRLRPYPAGGTHITRVVLDFKQFELMDFDALGSVSRSIDLEDEGIRHSWSSAVAIAPGRTLSVKRHEMQGVLAKQAEAVEANMYSASFLVDAPAGQVFEALSANQLVFDCNKLLTDGSLLHLDGARMLLRQVNGIVLLQTSRVKADQRHLLTLTVGHIAGKSAKDAMSVTSDRQVMSDPFYRLVNEWICVEQSESQTLVKRTMRDFKQTGHPEITDLANTLTEAADEENKGIIDAFRKMRLQQGGTPLTKGPTAISTRANYAMRQMPEILDMAAKNNVLEVREMLEVKGADPNYIHVREDTWAISDSRLTFYEEITPLVVAAEHGAVDVMKALFNHPQIDVNLCCCAFNDLEIYNYYTAYDMTISKKHPHAAALLRARGVLPANSEHVFKPPFDRVNMRPLRETVNNIYGEETDEDKMPSWEVISQGNPELATAMREVAEALSITKGQSLASRTKLFKNLVTDWHPDRHTSSGDAAVATKVFQWLQVVKPWYLEAGAEPATDSQPLPDDPDRPAPPSDAQQYLHPSGSVFQVW